ncbi:MAG: cobalamin biosynthesis protein [Gammaproteobacteria bacterium]|nr:cobalamin biosynthesis protein [Gammaproteobacteria bacterium]
MQPETIATFQQLIQQPWLQQPLLVLLVAVVSSVLPLPASYQPLVLFRLLAVRLATRVNKASYPSAQLNLSGSLAAMIAVVPWLILAWAFTLLSQVPALWHGLLLYFCLDWQNSRQQALDIQRSLSKQQLNLARDQLQPLVLREVRLMSEVGVSKACLESLLFRLATQWTAVLLWFLLGGVVLAIACRLMQELHQQWNPKRQKYRYFGQPVAWLVSVLNWPGMLLCATVLALLVSWRHSRHYLKFSNDGYFNWSARWLLAAGAAALKRNLAGPVYYDGQKIRRVRIGPVNEPQPSDIQLLLKLARQYQVGLLLMLTSYIGLTILGHWPQ